MYRITSEEIFEINGAYLSVEASLYVDTVANLPAYNAITLRTLLPGSTAVVIDTSEVYILDFNNTWKKWNPGGNTST